MPAHADVAVSTASVTAGRATRHRAFFPAMSLILLVAVFMGFAPTYYLRPASAPPIPGYLHVHGAAMTAWFLLLVLQTTLIAAKRRDVHKRAGIAGACIAVVIVLLNPLVVVWSVAHRPAGDPVELTALIVVGDLFLMAIFAVLATLAFAWRRYPESHSRLLLLASIAMSGPAFGRFSLAATGGPLPGVLTLNLMPLVVIAHDWLRMKRVHPVSAWAGAAIIGSLFVSIAIANSAAGPAIVHWLE